MISAGDGFQGHPGSKLQLSCPQHKSPIVNAKKTPNRNSPFYQAQRRVRNRSTSLN